MRHRIKREIRSLIPFLPVKACIVRTCSIVKFMGEGSFLNFFMGYGYQCSFGNMLDNAIESVVKIKDRQKRLISLHVIQDKQFIRIRTENYCRRTFSSGRNPDHNKKTNDSMDME